MRRILTRDLEVSMSTVQPVLKRGIVRQRLRLQTADTSGACLIEMGLDLQNILLPKTAKILIASEYGVLDIDESEIVEEDFKADR